MNDKYTKYETGWCLLDREEDSTMLKHGRKHNIENYNRWQERLIENHLIKYFLDKSNRRTVIDGGSSYGWMAVTFAKYFDQVKCFEVRDDVRSALKENTKALPNVEVFDCGLSQKEQIVTISQHTATGHTMITQEASSKSLASATSANPEEGKKVNSIDSFNFENVDCIKLDVEHHEFNVLLGAEETIKKWKPLLVVEVLAAMKRRPEPLGTILFEERLKIFKLVNTYGYEMIDVRGADFIFAHKSLNLYGDLTL